MGEGAGQSGTAAPEAPVVVRVRCSFRVLGLVVLGGLSVGVASSVVSAVVAGDPGAPLGRQGWSPHVVLGWLVSGTMLVVMVLGLWALLTYRTTWSREGVSSRALVLGWTVPVEDVARVVLEEPRNRSATGPRPAALNVVDRSGRVVAVLRPTETGWSGGLDVVRSWVRARPDLVADGDTAALLGAPPAG